VKVTPHCGSLLADLSHSPLTPTITHHGAITGVTGSCHQLTLADGQAVLIDCGLFQGAETSPDGRANASRLDIDFPLKGISALIVTHVHIDHVGRIPYLLGAGFKGPVVCSEASAELLPMVLQDALEVGFTRDRELVGRVLEQLREQIVPLPYGNWLNLGKTGAACSLKMRLQPAGHILGSAYVEFDAAQGGGPAERIVFSGDLGAPDTPLLPDPQPLERADVLVIESTYGDRVHESRKERRERLQAMCEHAFGNGGTVLIPAFSIGRTQELLYELEEIVHEHPHRPAALGIPWGELAIVVDSPLAADFTRGYARLKAHWDQEARTLLKAGRHPLDFEQVTTVGLHADHLRMVQTLAATGYPAIVIAASGMCSGGRIVNYLKAMLPDPRHEVLFCGYQAAGTPGRAIQAAGRDNQAGGARVRLDDEEIEIRAGIHTLGGYSAHADQKNLLDFVGGMATPPRQVRVVHGDGPAKQEFARLLQQRHGGVEVVIP